LAPAPNAFTGALLDRAEDGRRRDDAWLAAQSRHPGARALVAGDAGVLACAGRLELRPLSEAGDPSPGVLLGLDEVGPVFALDDGRPVPPGERTVLIGAGGRRGEPAPEAPDRLGLRQAAAVLGQAEGGLAVYATALLNWHRSHRFCANCATATHAREGGLMRLCPTCGTQHHPRTDPVVIMLVTAGSRLLLGRQRAWPAGRYSALAGFVSPGESLEEAVVREVGEEAGVQVGPPAYVSSQPWPFPASLMVGFTVSWSSGEPVSTDELEDVRWFERDEVAEAALVDDSWEASEQHDRDLLLPPRSAIARRLIEGWLEAPA